MSKQPSISIAIGFEIIALFLTSSLSKWASYQGFHQINFITPELPDIGHHFLPFSSEAPFLADFVGLALLSSLIALYCITKPTASIRHFIQTFCFIHAPLLLLRISLIVSTVLPSPVPECRNMDRYKTCTACQDIADFYPSLTTWYCNDLMFSGHKMTNLVCCSFWLAAPVRNAFKVSASVVCGCGIVLLIQGRQHYTADILVALYLTLAVVYIQRMKLYDIWSVKQD